MKQEKFSQNLEQAKAELKQLQTDVYHTIGVEEEKEELWKTQLPMIEEAIAKFTEDNGKYSRIDERIIDISSL